MTLCTLIYPFKVVHTLYLSGMLSFLANQSGWCGVHLLAGLHGRHAAQHSLLVWPRSHGLKYLR